MLDPVKQTISWRKIKSVLYVMALLCVVVLIQLIINRSYQDEGKLIRAFESTKATPVRGKLQVVGNFGDKYMTTEDKENLIDHISSKLGITDPLEKKKVEGDTTISISARAEGPSSETDIEAISITTEEQEKIHKTTQYLYVTIDLYDGLSSVLGYKDIIEDTFSEVGLKNIDTSLLLTGVYDGKLTLLEKNRITDDIMSQLQAEVVAENRSESLYTVYGYTPNIATSLEMEDKKVNVNVAFSYDEAKEETTLYLASPVVNEDY